MGWGRNDRCFTHKHSHELSAFVMATRQNTLPCVRNAGGWIYAARGIGRRAEGRERQREGETPGDRLHTDAVGTYSGRYNRLFG